MQTSSGGNIQREFSWPVRVYWEDTDAGGVVYHASYVRFLERGRSEWLRALGIHQQALATDRDLLFAIRAMQLDFLRAARLDDELTVRTSMKSRRGASLVFEQGIWRSDELVLRAEVRAVCLVASSFRPQPLPDDLFTDVETHSLF
ncbi:MAG: tol-pal system-associated acyl-CoA thioesterase [Xanthomonadales bacterium]|nr:tol-pal system-associated acyl-CoA thioesterase [Xanthomonadales bacterium]